MMTMKAFIGAFLIGGSIFIIIYSIVKLVQRIRSRRHKNDNDVIDNQVDKESDD